MQNRDPRSYYGDQNGQFSAGQPYDSGNYASASSYTSYDYQQQSPQYYAATAQTHSASPPHPYYRSMTPGIPSHRYSNSSSSRDYYPASGVMNHSSSPQPAISNQEYYQSQYSGSGIESRSPTAQTQFIPTPSEMAHSYSNYPHPVPSPSSTMSSSYVPGAAGYHSPVQMLPQSQQPPRPSRISTGRPRTASGTATSPTSATSPPGERFPCEKCGKTFSRSHDRKRHHETQHLPTPVIHRCRYCEKEFSRADSLKRHLDNGCDEMPQ
ncbi:hypothetical protein AGABI1DRAFT_126673 [Agaricus bisporus var. burnettii JB137-S8]|uniref:C2H2-type domain-containing protein n=1 Tax=Agaricus bisporus var. burnettii (strain JB137-S8 / ATCC MYA-4627 / FGSC 10392) TaxID=597362 RepID=K5WYQ7_AGABU|nr:uncharacterized protein AGABI1DRAFT_126673 [Agaricus bisporus var. burnettii JB137-S8]EKM80616.1 hypothetical protein AGABI1DRAFT_126673 [Agaricus bisporus var. burnettii JB137-S8]